MSIQNKRNDTLLHSITPFYSALKRGKNLYRNFTYGISRASFTFQHSLFTNGHLKINFTPHH